MKAFSRRYLFWITLFLLLTGVATWAYTGGVVEAQDKLTAGEIHSFELLGAGEGWVWSGAALLWSEDGGLTWQDITPGDTNRYQIAAVHFATTSSGWVLLLPRSAPPAAGAPALLARTPDSGVTWQFAALPEKLAQEVASAKAVYLSAHAGGRGWLATTAATSSNFSRGSLWYTEDGGGRWQPRTLPAGEAPQFIDENNGWLAGGLRGDQIWRTHDGGATWDEVALPRQPQAGERLMVYTPLAAPSGEIVLPLLVRSEAAQTAEWYAGSNAGNTWQLVQRITPPVAAHTRAAEVDARAWLAAEVGAVLPSAAPLPFFANPAVLDGLRLAQVKMTNEAVGWGLAEAAAQESQLLATHDEGRTWQPLVLPATAPRGGAMTQDYTLAAAGAWATVTRTTIARGPGFDTCELPSPAELATWYTASPYRVVNLYLGGILRFCDNKNLSAGTLEQLATQGWTFIPTWVGPQAPCSGYRTRFSSDPAEAYAQGRAEADEALAAAKALGLTESDGSGTIIYYDMESFDAIDQACIAATQSFVTGWTSRLHERGSQSGLYGSACSPRMDAFAFITAPPDAVWVAQWRYEGSFDPQVTVWGMACLDDTLWARSQRIRQYTGGHDETWGGVTLNIDSNVVDSLVATVSVQPPTPTPSPSPTATPTATPTPQPTVVLETPLLEPMYDGGMCGAGWHMAMNERNYPAYLAANHDRNGTVPPGDTARQAVWAPTIPADGNYRVEVYIPGHNGVTWRCPEALLPQNTSSAHYIVRHADGTATKVANQAAVRSGWLLLGIYPFRAWQPAQVTLETATDEAAFTRTVTASALRVTRVEAGAPGSYFLYLPQVNRRE